MPFIMEQRANRLSKYARILAHGLQMHSNPHINKAVISGSPTCFHSCRWACRKHNISCMALQNIPIDIATIPSNCLSILSSSSTTNALVITQHHLQLKNLLYHLLLINSLLSPIGGTTTNSTTFTVTLLVSCI